MSLVTRNVFIDTEFFCKSKPGLQLKNYKII